MLWPPAPDVNDGHAAPFGTLTVTKHRTLLPPRNYESQSILMTDEPDPNAIPSAPPGVPNQTERYWLDIIRRILQSAVCLV